MPDEMYRTKYYGKVLCHINKMAFLLKSIKSKPCENSLKWEYSQRTLASPLTPQAVLWLVQCSILLTHLSKIICHNEEKQPLLNKVKNSDLDPLLLLCCTGTEGQVTASWNHVRTAITRHKSPTQGLKNTGWRRQQRLLFVPLSVTLCRTAFHNGFLLQSTVFLYQAHFVLDRKRADALRHMMDNLCVSSFRLPSAVVTLQDLSHGQHRINIFPPRACVHDTQSFLLLTFVRGDNVAWLGGVMWPCGAAVSSVRYDCSADLAVQPLELCQPRLGWLSCWRLTAQWQGLEPLL